QKSTSLLPISKVFICSPVRLGYCLHPPSNLHSDFLSPLIKSAAGLYQMFSAAGLSCKNCWTRPLDSRQILEITTTSRSRGARPTVLPMPDFADSPANQPRLVCPLGFRSPARRLVLARDIKRHCSADEILQGRLIDLVAFVDVDGAPCISVKTGVEETGWILQRCAVEEGKLHNILVRFASADHAVVRPNRSAGVGWFDPLPLLDDVGVCFLDKLAHSAEGFAAPIVEFGDSFRDEFRCRLVLVCS